MAKGNEFAQYVILMAKHWQQTINAINQQQQIEQAEPSIGEGQPNFTVWDSPTDCCETLFGGLLKNNAVVFVDSVSV